MTYTGIFCTQLDVTRRAGLNASSWAIASELLFNDYVAAAESFINASTFYNWSDVYSGLNADKKYVLQEAAACLAAMNVINYDMSGYTSRDEAQTMLDVLRDRAVMAIEVLKEDVKKKFVQAA